MLTRRTAGPGSVKARDDNGFTLIELLVSITVLGIVMGGLTAIMFGALTTDVSTKLRMDETRDQQYAAAYFSVDAQAATTILSAVTAKCGTGTAVVEFQGSSYDATSSSVPPPATVTVVSYVFSTAMVNGKLAGQLRRQSCEAPASPPPTYPLTVKATTTVARTLVTTAPGVVCVTPLDVVAACGTGSASVTLSATRRSGDTPFQIVGTRRTTP